MRPETRAYLKTRRGPRFVTGTPGGDQITFSPAFRGGVRVMVEDDEDLAMHVLDREETTRLRDWLTTYLDTAPENPAGVLLAAADLLETTAATAPTGPYTTATRPILGDSHMMFAADGDAFAVVSDWAGGHGNDTGTPEQTAAHLKMWTPQVARCVAAWLRSVADLHEPPNRPPGCQWCTDEDWPCADMRHALNTARALLNPKNHT